MQNLPPPSLLKRVALLRPPQPKPQVQTAAEQSVALSLTSGLVGPALHSIGLAKILVPLAATRLLRDAPGQSAAGFRGSWDAVYQRDATHGIKHNEPEAGRIHKHVLFYMLL